MSDKASIREASFAMAVKILDYLEYPGNGQPPRHTRTLQPKLSEIEAAVRRLDRHRFPFLFVWKSTDPTMRELSWNEDVFEVMGGEGVWRLAGTAHGYFQRRLDDPEKGDEEITVWTSDQGFADCERHICRDVEAVVHAALFFAEHGGFDPRLSWEERQS